MVLRRSNAFTRICSRITSRLSRSISALALISAFTRARSFCFRNSDSCSTVSVHQTHQVTHQVTHKVSSNMPRHGCVLCNCSLWLISPVSTMVYLSFWIVFILFFPAPLKMCLILLSTKLRLLWASFLYLYLVVYHSILLYLNCVYIDVLLL